MQWLVTVSQVSDECVRIDECESMVCDKPRCLTSDVHFRCINSTCVWSVGFFCLCNQELVNLSVRHFVSIFSVFLAICELLTIQLITIAKSNFPDNLACKLKK